MVFNGLHRFRYIFHKTPIADNFVFYLCYRWTVLILVVFSFIITCRLFFGYSFTCTNHSRELPTVYVNIKCYSENVYTESKSDASGSIPAPTTLAFRRYQTYYSWVNLLLLLQAVIFYLPHLLWKTYEGGYIRRLSVGVEKFFDKEEKRGLELCYLAKYVIVTQGKHTSYTILYVFLEACNYAIALAQTLWLVSFFDVTGVPDGLSIKLSTWVDFRNFYFPSEAKCDHFERSGFGSPERLTMICLLPLNYLHMIMFLFLHVWYIFVTILCGAVLIYRIALLAPSFRVYAMKIMAPLAEKSILKSLCYRLSYSDWFFLTRLQKAMADVDFAQMVDKIAIVSQGKSGDSERDDDHRSSIFDSGRKELDNSTVTSPL